jgi:hypothetical protein
MMIQDLKNNPRKVKIIMEVKTEREEVFLSVIKQLVIERDKWEFRAKHPLPEGWSYPEFHPRIGEVVSFFPNILKPQP